MQVGLFKSKRASAGKIALAAAVTLLGVADRASAIGGIVYVFTAGTQFDLSTDYLNALGGKYQTSPSNIVIITPGSMGAAVNGTFVNYAGFSGNVVQFNLLGDFNLGATDNLVAFGPNPIQINVAGNSSIASGATISADALVGTAGAGGGSGGGAGVRPNVGDATDPGRGGQIIAAAQKTPVNNRGVDGGAGTAATFVDGNFDALNSHAGGGGTLGVNTTSLGGPNGGAGTSKLVTSTTLAQGGAGGTGGNAGTESSPDGGAGGGGQGGGRGDDGLRGQSGGGGTAFIGLGLGTPILHGGGGGGGGSNGGDGMASGGGGQAGSGGGGYYTSGIIIDPNATDVPYGGPAPGGRSGTHGAQGFNGGAGGAGGGGIAITVGGRLTLNGQISANGENGGNAAYNYLSAGNPVIPGSPGIPGGVGNDGTQGGASGRIGGNTAGTAGIGAGGGGGAGGSVYIVASSYYQNSANALVAAGGMGGTSNDGQPIYDLNSLILPIPIIGYTDPTLPGNAGSSGDIRVNSLGGNTISGTATPTAAGHANPYRNTVVRVLQNNSPPNTPNFTDSIEGGVAAYGRATTSSGAIDTNYGLVFANTTPNIPTNAIAAVTLTNAPTDYTANYNQLNYTSLGGNVAKPAFKLFTNVDPHNPLYVSPPGLQPPTDPAPVGAPLLSSGWQTDPQFVPGAAGEQVISTLGGLQTYRTMVEKPVAGTFSMLVGQFAPYTNLRTFTEVYAASSGPAPLYLTDTGLANFRINMNGEAAGALFYNMDAETRDPGGSTYHYRAGSGAQAITVTAFNSGHAGSLTSGTFTVGSASQTFSNLPANNPGGTATFSTPYSSPLKAGHADTVPVNLSSDAGSVVGNLNVSIVGPDLQVLPATAFHSAQPGASQTALYQLVNFADVLPAYEDPSLTNLDILGVTVLNNPSGSFSTPANALTYPFIPAGGFASGGFSFLSVNFNGQTQPGTYTATLELLTDQNAGYLQAGDVFDIPLSVTVVPEPSTLGLLMGSSLLLKRRRSMRNARRGPQRA